MAYWRLARLYRAEAGAIAHRRGSAERDLAQAQAQARLWARGFPHLVPDAADRLRTEQEALETAMGDPRTLRAYLVARDPELDAVESDRLESLAQDFLAQIRQQRAALLQQRRATENASRSLPPVDVATKYARYETALQNQLDRALSRLERLQRARTGDYVAPPLHIDVTGIEAPHADP